MTPPLYPFYETELHFIRKLAQEFAKKYPAAAARLQLEPDRSADPHVERLIEAFALLSARVQNKLHDEFPELTDAMLSVLYPHVLAPIPSLTTVQFTIDAARGIPEGVTIPAGGLLHTARAGALQCRFRTCYPVTLWPITVAEARLHPPPYPPGLNPPARAVAALRLRIQCTGELTLDKLKLDRLRLHLVGDNAAISPLYDLIFNNALSVSFAAPGRPSALLQLPAAEALLPVGFEEADSLMPYPPNVFAGYRLLTEYFAYPAKFLYVDIAGWDRLPQVGPLREIEVVIFLNRTNQRLEQIIDANTFRAGCTPAINLFEQTAEPMQLTHTKPEHRIVPDVAHSQGYEIFSVQSVTASSAEAGDREFHPFYHYRHGHDRNTAQTFYFTTRRPSLTPDDRGTDVSIHMVDAGFDPASGTNETAVIRTLCTNRDLPIRLPRVGDHVTFTTGFAAPGTKVKCIRNPTGSLRPLAPAGRYWHLISHLNINHLSLTNDTTGLDALRGLLRLYDPTDTDGEPQASALAKQSIEGVAKIGSKRTTAWVGGGDLGGFVRGLEIELTLDETRFVGGSGFLFASVLERFFALHVSINSFTQLVARFQQHDGEFKRWPPRAGDRPLA